MKAMAALFYILATDCTTEPQQRPFNQIFVICAESASVNFGFPQVSLQGRK